MVSYDPNSAIFRFLYKKPLPSFPRVSPRYIHLLMQTASMKEIHDHQKFSRLLNELTEKMKNQKF